VRPLPHGQHRPALRKLNTFSPTPHRDSGDHDLVDIHKGVGGKPHPFMGDTELRSNVEFNEPLQALQDAEGRERKERVIRLNATRYEEERRPPILVIGKLPITDYPLPITHYRLPKRRPLVGGDLTAGC
jgi:hypothetical protein